MFIYLANQNWGRFERRMIKKIGLWAENLQKKICQNEWVKKDLNPYWHHFNSHCMVFFSQIKTETETKIITWIFHTVTSNSILQLERSLPFARLIHLRTSKSCPWFVSQMRFERGLLDYWYRLQVANCRLSFQRRCASQFERERERERIGFKFITNKWQILCANNKWAAVRVA